MHDDAFGYILQGYPASIESGHVIDDHIVADSQCVPVRIVPWRGGHILAVDREGVDTATATGSGQVPLNQVLCNCYTAGSGATHTGNLTAEIDTTTVPARNGETTVEHLIKDNSVTGDQTAVTEANMGDTTTGEAGNIPFDLVIGHSVARCIIVDGDTTSTLDTTVLDNPVVVNIQPGVVRIGNLWCTDNDTATEVPLVVGNYVMADLQVVRIVADVNTTAGQRALDGKACDHRIEEISSPVRVADHHDAGGLIRSEWAETEILNLLVPIGQPLGRNRRGRDGR